MANSHSPSIVVERSIEEGKVNGSREFTMQTTYPAPSNLQKIFAELIGTYILIFIGCGAIIVNKAQPLTIVGIALVWGFVLMALIYALGHVSGAHFNPAVTIAFAAARKFPWIHVPMYATSQLLGATLASVTVKALLGEQHSVSAMVNSYTSPTTDLQAFTWEFIATFVLMFTILAVATDHRASKDLAGVAIGTALLAIVMVVGPITGASFNPARSFGPAVVAGSFSQLWVFIVARILGASAASMVYMFLRVSKSEKPDVIKSTIDLLCHRAEV